MNRKEIIRQRIRERRKRLSPAWIRQTSTKTQRLVQNLDEWKNANRICCYLALPREVQTQLLIKASWNAGKRVCVPAFRKTDGHYDLAWLRQDETLTTGYGSVPEPAEPDWVAARRSKIRCSEEHAKSGTWRKEQDSVDLVIIPGVAFDRSGGRLGHGRGHYDRLLMLKVLAGAFKLGIAFEFQLLDEVPAEAHDIQMDAVVTEKNVYRK